MCTMKLTFCPQLWYVDIIDQFSGMLVRADRVIIGECVSNMDYPTKTFVCLHTFYSEQGLSRFPRPAVSI
jgi:hypothetical protein